VSTPSTTIMAVAVQLSLSLMPIQSTMDIFLLDEEGTLIEPSQKLCSSISRSLKGTGMSIARGNDKRLTVSSDLPAYEAGKAAEMIARWILAYE